MGGGVLVSKVVCTSTCGRVCTPFTLDVADPDRLKAEITPSLRLGLELGAIMQGWLQMHDRDEYMCN